MRGLSDDGNEERSIVKVGKIVLGFHNDITGKTDNIPLEENGGILPRNKLHTIAPKLCIDKHHKRHFLFHPKAHVMWERPTHRILLKNKLIAELSRR